VTYAADTFFDFNKSALKADGKAKLDDWQSQSHQPRSDHCCGSH
jgi:outer membrane protein OmpA-like peptidoglycan-associated protein